jgi:hypothetical protein
MASSKKIWPIVRSLGAVTAGYAVIVVGTTLTFETLLEGVSYQTSSRTELALASAGAFLSGLAGGFAAAWLAGRRPVLHAAGVLVWLTFDTTWVITSGVSKDPIWFDLAGSLTLMVSAVCGGFLQRALQRSPGAAPARAKKPA